MKRQIIIFLMMFAWSSSSYSGVEIVTVEAYGQGVSKAEAVKAAEVAAVGQVSGELLSAYSSMNKASLSVSATDGENNAAVGIHARSMNSSIESLVKGVLKSTSILSVSRNPNTGLYDAKIRAGVVRMAQDGQMKRRRIALLTSNSTNYTGTVTDTLRSTIEADLVASKKMAVLDRAESDSLESEVQLMQSDRAPIEDRVKAMNMPTADMIGLVAVNQIYDVKNPLGMKMTELDATLTVIDVGTRQIKFKKTMKTLFPGDPESVLIDVSKKTGKKIAKALLNYAYPMIVISVDGDVAVVSGGSNQLKVGQAVGIYKLGKELKDPYTGERIGEEETGVGTGSVTDVKPAYSRIKCTQFDWNPKSSYLVKLDEKEAKTPNKPIVNESDW